MIRVVRFVLIDVQNFRGAPVMELVGVMVTAPDITRFKTEI